MQTIIKENLYDSLSVTAELDRLQAALQLDTLLSPASRPGPDSVVWTSQLQPAVDGPSQSGAPASLLAAAAADIVVEIVAEEVLESAIELLQEELRKAQEVDTLLHILFPTVMLQVQQNRPEMPAQLILRQLHDALRYDFGQLDTRFPYALQQLGRLDTQSVQVVEEGTYWLEQYHRGGWTHLY